MTPKPPRADCPYDEGSLLAKGWWRGWNEAVICGVFEVPMSLVLPSPARGVGIPQ